MERKGDLHWSWKPILQVFRVLGIELRDPSIFPASRLYLGYSLLCFCFNFTSHAADLITTLEILKTFFPPHVTFTLVLSIILESVNNTLHSVGIHLAMFAMTRSRWSLLWQSFQQVGTKFSDEFHVTLRKFSAMMVFVVTFLEIYIFIATITYSAYSRKISFYPHGIGFCTMIAEAFRISGSVLFVGCALSASAVFTFLNKEIDEAKKKETSVNISHILKWKRTHAQACECIHHINRCFGSILLIEFICISFRVITTAFHTYLGIRDKSLSRFTIYQMMYALELSFQFWIICAAANKTNSKAMDVIKGIRSLYISSIDAQRLRGVFLTHIHNSTPVITAAGVLEINLKLVPKLIGTTVSYIVILNQFSSLEKTQKGQS